MLIEEVPFEALPPNQLTKFSIAPSLLPFSLPLQRLSMTEQYRFLKGRACLLAGIFAPIGAAPSFAELSTPPISTKAVAAKPSPEIPKYVSSFDELSERYRFLGGSSEKDWLLFGLQQRTRLESLDNFYRVPTLPSDEGVFTRTRLYLGVAETLDPFRLTIELEDSRRGSSDFPTNLRQGNRADLLQGYLELYFDEAIAGQSLSLQAGRFTIDAVDRRLLARNRYRNSANAFDGVRLQVGDQTSPWMVNLFATRPVEPRAGTFDDRSREEQSFYGAFGSFRGNSPSFVFEPYYFYLNDERNPGTSSDRSIHTAGVHAFGVIGDDLFDYDFSGSAQWGDVNGLDHFAYAIHAEVAHTFDHPWKPRLAAWINYASGDDDPLDGDSGRFSQLFGASFGAYGFTRYFSWENLINPAISLSFQPHAQVRCEIFLRNYSLASDTDAWVRTGRRDATGGSGGDLGNEIDVRVRWQASEAVLLDSGFARYFAGDFVGRTGIVEDSTLAYLQATWQF